MEVEEAPPVAVERRQVALPAIATIGEISERASVDTAEIIVELLGRGVLATINAAIDRETATAVLGKFDIDVVDAIAATEPDRAPETEDAESSDAEPDAKPIAEGDPRPPVVTVMGHVDHGKTTLLDSIRKTNVVDSEHGGITQHIGAYQVDTDHGPITFIDTPGHAAFTAMRSRGAGVTDIAIIVVAADDGVMPQTIEAIGHARAAGVPVIVAVNKVDLEGANQDRVFQQLTEHDIVVEAYGGKVVAVPVSALKGEGIDDLLEYINLTAQIEELRAPTDGLAQGTVIETHLDRSRGPMATVIVQRGTLKLGDAVRFGGTEGKVRAMFDHNGDRVRSAGPSTPVEVMGLAELPTAGLPMEVVKPQRGKRRIQRSAPTRPGGEQAMRLSLESLAQQMTAGKLQQLSVVVKADTDGVVEAVVRSLNELGDTRSRAAVVFEGVGAVTESDVNLAAAAGGIVVGFNVRVDPTAAAEAKRQGVDVRIYLTIYDLIDEIEAALLGLIKPEQFEVIDGRLEIRGEFRRERTRQIVGGMVLSGRIVSGSEVRILREDEQVGAGRIVTLRRFSDPVEEVREGFDCGLAIDTTTPIQLADVIEVFHTEERIPQA